ncbi:MAG: patatin-like phospholipase family protein, partial [Actinomycetia bacterium]|nr:patatin-like phospholipase family protein [Actinomycetes bacterium]
MVRYLADAGLLGNLWISSSVSGGSVANGIIATNWGKLRDRDFSAPAVDELLIDPTVKRIAKRSL